MTVQELAEYSGLKTEIELYSKQIDYWTSAPPLGTNRAEKAKYRAAVQDLVSLYIEILKQRKEQLSRLQSFFDGIENPAYKYLFHLRYVRGFEWLQVWDHMADAGYEYAPDSCKKIARRYIDKAAAL